MGVALGDPFRPPIRRVDVGLPVGVVLGGRGGLLVFPFQALAEMRAPTVEPFRAGADRKMRAGCRAG